MLLGVGGAGRRREVGVTWGWLDKQQAGRVSGHRNSRDLAQLLWQTSSSLHLETDPQFLRTGQSMDHRQEHCLVTVAGSQGLLADADKKAAKGILGPCSNFVAVQPSKIRQKRKPKPLFLQPMPPGFTDFPSWGRLIAPHGQSGI